MRRANAKGRPVDDLASRYFESDMRRVRAHEPPEGLVESGRRSPERPLIPDGLLRAFAAAVCAGSIAFLPGLMRGDTPLREAVARALREKTYQQYVPNLERMMTIIRDSFERKETI